MYHCLGDGFDLGFGVVSDDVALDSVGGEHLGLGGEEEKFVGLIDGTLMQFQIGPGVRPDRRRKS